MTSPVGFSEEFATEQGRVEEQQRIFSIIPNFYVVYDHNAAPLTTNLKFKLASEVAFDPGTILGVGVLAGINQAGDVPNHGQGVKGSGERYSATYTDGFTHVKIGGAILPSLLHQDPRHFYQGTGAKKSRAPHALSNSFICRRDHGRRQPNYSTLGGDRLRQPSRMPTIRRPIAAPGWFSAMPLSNRRARACQPGPGVHPAQARARSQKSKLARMQARK